MVLAPATVNGAEHIAAPKTPLVSQTITTPQGAVLDGPARVKLNWLQTIDIPAGTPMFLFDVGGDKTFCAVPEGYDESKYDTLACFTDDAGDGRFDIVRTAYDDAHVPFLVFGLNGPVHLATPIAYHLVPAEQAPKIEVQLRWTPWNPNFFTMTKGPVADRIAVYVVYKYGKKEFDIQTYYPVTLDQEKKGVWNKQGASIIFKGLAVDGSIRYEVTSGLPAKTDRLVRRTSTTVTAVSVRR